MSRMRDAARKMEERHFSDRTTEHVEFLPVEWRSKLFLDGGQFALSEQKLKRSKTLKGFPAMVARVPLLDTVKLLITAKPLFA